MTTVGGHNMDVKTSEGHWLLLVRDHPCIGLNSMATACFNVLSMCVPQPRHMKQRLLIPGSRNNVTAGAVMVPVALELGHLA